MALENVRITKNVRNNVNRAANCDNANVDKTMDAARRQIEAIEQIEREMGFARLPRHLREMAEIRLENPETPMKELGECFDPPSARARSTTGCANSWRLPGRCRQRKGNDSTMLQQTIVITNRDGLERKIRRYAWSRWPAATARRSSSSRAAKSSTANP